MTRIAVDPGPAPKPPKRAEKTPHGIRRVSPRRARQERAYTPLRAAFLEANPRCQSPLNCGQPATEVQHRRGRQGERLLDVAWWAASCHDCNQAAETNTGWAYATGWLVRIESADVSPAEAQETA